MSAVGSFETLSVSPQPRLAPAMALGCRTAGGPKLALGSAANARCHGDINEWVDGAGLPRGVGNYSASASSAYAAAAALRCQPYSRSPEPSASRLRTPEIKGDHCGNLSGRWNFSGESTRHVRSRLKSALRLPQLPSDALAYRLRSRALRRLGGDVSKRRAHDSDHVACAGR